MFSPCLLVVEQAVSQGPHTEGEKRKVNPQNHVMQKNTCLDCFADFGRVVQPPVNCCIQTPSLAFD